MNSTRSPEDERLRREAVGYDEHLLHAVAMLLFHPIPAIAEIERRLAARIPADPHLSEPPARCPIAAALRLETATPAG